MNTQNLSADWVHRETEGRSVLITLAPSLPTHLVWLFPSIDGHSSCQLSLSSNLAISSGFRQSPSPLPLQKRWHRFFMWLASEYHSFLMWLASKYHALLVVPNIFPHLCKEHLNYPTEFTISLLLRYIKIMGKHLFFVTESWPYLKKIIF